MDFVLFRDMLSRKRCTFAVGSTKCCFNRICMLITKLTFSGILVETNSDCFTKFIIEV
jgi:hypothetical protein